MESTIGSGLNGGMDLGHPERVLPRGESHEVLRPEGTDLVVVTYRSGGRPCMVAWAGRSAKSLLHYSYPNESQRDSRLQGIVSAKRRAAAEKVARLEARRAFRHTLQVGDVLVSTWGYDQTNVDFYEVVARTDKTVDLERIGSVTAEEKAWMVRTVQPDPAHRSGKVLKAKRVSERNVVKIGESRWANPHDGKPVTETSYA